MPNSNRFTDYCVKGLEPAYIPSERVFATRRLDKGKMVHVRDHEIEYLATMNALMGLHCARSHGSKVFLDIESDYQATAARLEEYSRSSLHIAATFWTGRCLGIEIPPHALSLFKEILENTSRQNYPDTKSMTWAIVACLTGDDEYHNDALALAKAAGERYINQKTLLVRQVRDGIRENWASFGAHSLMAYALLLLARKTGDSWARDMGLSIARKLVQLQGTKGQWGWMYHVPSGRLVDFYPVFSVHQYGYAAFFLVEAIDQGYEEFREPFLRGFQWVLGQNELGQSMVAPEHQIIWRYIIRKPPNPILKKMLRGTATYLGLQKAAPLGADLLQIDQQCWGFEMALPLCIFSGRQDFREILDSSCFS